MKRPLDGHRILITRPGKAGEDLCTMIEGLGAQVRHLPTIAIEYRHSNAQGLTGLESTDFLLLTSSHACHVMGHLETAGAQFAVLAVGEQTAILARQAGWKIAVASKVGGFHALLKDCDGIDFAGKTLMWPRSGLADLKAMKAFEERGAVVHSFVAYDVTNPLLPQSVSVLGQTAAVFASPSAVKNLESAMVQEELDEARTSLRALAIGRTTAHELRQRGWQKIQVASQPSNEGILAAALEHLSQGCR